MSRFQSIRLNPGLTPLPLRRARAGAGFVGAAAAGDGAKDARDAAAAAGFGAAWPAASA